MISHVSHQVIPQVSKFAVKPLRQDQLPNRLDGIVGELRKGGFRQPPLDESLFLLGQKRHAFLGGRSLRMSSMTPAE